MSSRNLKNISLLFLVATFLLLGWLKWSSSQDQTEIEPNMEPRWLLFHSNTCEACAKMMDLSTKLKEDYSGKVEFILIDIYDESNEKIASDYNISFIPTSVFEVRGKEHITKIGEIPEEELREILDSLVIENE